MVKWLKKLFRRGEKKKEEKQEEVAEGVFLEEEQIQTSVISLQPRSIVVPYTKLKTAIVLSGKGGVGKSVISNAMLCAFGAYTAHDVAVLDFDLLNATCTRMVLTSKYFTSMRSGIGIGSAKTLACALVDYLRGSTTIFKLPDPKKVHIALHAGRERITWKVLILPATTEPDTVSCIENGIKRYGTRARRELTALVPEIVRLFGYNVLSVTDADCKLLIVDTPPIRPLGAREALIEFEYSLARLASLEPDKMDLLFIVVLPPQPEEAVDNMRIISARIPLDKIKAIFVSMADVHVFKRVVTKLSKSLKGLDIDKVVRVPYNPKWNDCYKDSKPIIPSAEQDLFNPSESLIAVMAGMCKAGIFPEAACVEILKKAEELSLLTE